MNENLIASSAETRRALSSYQNINKKLTQNLESINTQLNDLDQVMIGINSTNHINQFNELLRLYEESNSRIQDILVSIENLCERSGNKSDPVSENIAIPEAKTSASGFDVFISYSSKENYTAIQVLNTLRNNNITCWMAPDSIPAGSDYASEIQTALESCRIFVLLLSENSPKSIWVTKELDQALSLNKAVIPLHLDQSELSKSYIFRLTNVQRIEAYEKMNDSLKALVHRISILKQQ